MILYNVTVSLDASIHTDWLEWMRNVHIPEVMATGYFVEHKICKLLVDDEITYAIQYNCETLENLNEYQEKYSPALQQKHTERYKGKFGTFRTLLEIIE